MQTWLSNEIEKSYNFVGYHFLIIRMRVMFCCDFLNLFLKINYLLSAAWVFIAPRGLSLFVVSQGHSLVVEPRPLIVMASLVVEEPNSGLLGHVGSLVGSTQAR